MNNTIKTIRELATQVYGANAFHLYTNTKNHHGPNVKTAYSKTTYSLTGAAFKSSKDLCNILRSILETAKRRQTNVTKI